MFKLFASRQQTIKLTLAYLNIIEETCWSWCFCESEDKACFVLPGEEEDGERRSERKKKKQNTKTREEEEGKSV